MEIKQYHYISHQAICTNGRYRAVINHERVSVFELTEEHVIIERLWNLNSYIDHREPSLIQLEIKGDIVSVHVFGVCADVYYTISNPPLFLFLYFFF